MSERVLQWVIGLAVGVIPVLLNLAIVGLTPITLSWSSVLGRGELLMLAVGLSASAILDLALSKGEPSWAKTSGIVLCLFSALAALGLYAVIVTARAFEVEVVGFWVAIVSLLPYVLSVFVSGSCATVLRRRS